MTVSLPRLLTVAEIAKHLRCSPPTARTLIRRGDLPAIIVNAVPGKARKSKTGEPLPPRVSGVRVLEDDLAAYIQSRRSNGGGR